MKTKGYSALLDDDVRAAFLDDQSVNEALRVVLTAAKALANRTSIAGKTKRRKHNYEKKTNCRVRAISRGKVLYETETHPSSPRLRLRILRTQRKLLEKAHPELKDMKNVRYELQWLDENDRWVTDDG